MGTISPSLYRAGEGEQLVLLHGFSGTWRLWRPILPELVARYEVFAPTLAGHDGGPPFPAGTPLTPSAAADVLEGHLDDIGVDGAAHLVGNSMGGALALELAKRGRARSVVALAPGGGWDPGGGEAARLARIFTFQHQLARRSVRFLPRILRSPRNRRRAFRLVMRRGELVAPADAVQMTRSMLACDLYWPVVESLRSNAAHLDGLDSIDAPVLLAWPERDRLLPMSRHSERFRAEIPGAEFTVLRGTGHVPVWDDPQLVVDAITGFASRDRSALQAL